MKQTQNLHRGTCLRYLRGCWVPAVSQQLNVPFDGGAPAKFKMNRMDAVCVNDDEILIACFASEAETAWGMAKANTEAKRPETGSLKKRAVPLLRMFPRQCWPA